MKRCAILSVMICLLLSGCTQVSDRIYTICAFDEDNIYCYNASGEFYRYVDGRVYKTLPDMLENKPALLISDVEVDYTLTEDIPNCYPMNRKQFCSLVNDLAEEGSYVITSANSYKIDVTVTTPAYSVKLYYDDNMELCRAYGVDSANNPVTVVDLLE